MPKKPPGGAMMHLQPCVRIEHRWNAFTTTTAVWTDTGMIVWGGYSSSNLLTTYHATGGHYRPDREQAFLDPWVDTITMAAPTPRRGHSAVWTGNSMIVWGGSDGSVLNNGKRYNPDTRRWTSITSTDAPSARKDHAAIWDGTTMFILGGNDGSDDIAGGSRYDPAANVWMPMTTTNPPSARSGNAVVWTGSEMVVWGGHDSPNDFNDTYGYKPGRTVYLYLKQ